MKIKLPCNLVTGWKVVEAEIVDIAPHLSGVATFAVHRRPWDDLWQISEVETGCNLRPSLIHRTKFEAVAVAESALKHISPQKMRALHKKAIRTGPSRGYQRIA